MGRPPRSNPPYYHQDGEQHDCIKTPTFGLVFDGNRMWRCGDVAYSVLRYTINKTTVVETVLNKLSPLLESQLTVQDTVPQTLLHSQLQTGVSPPQYEPEQVKKLQSPYLAQHDFTQASFIALIPWLLAERERVGLTLGTSSLVLQNTQVS